MAAFVVYLLNIFKATLDKSIGSDNPTSSEENNRTPSLNQISFLFCISLFRKSSVIEDKAKPNSSLLLLTSIFWLKSFCEIEFP